MFHPLHSLGLSSRTRRSANRATRSRRRGGFTLTEVLTVSAVMVMLAGTLAALASAVQLTSNHHYSQGLAMQHGRVVLQRIERTLRSAATSEQFPGFFAFSHTAGSYRYPDTLIVWSPRGTPADADGMPRMEELVIFKPDNSEPGRLLELRPLGDTREAPAVSDRAAWLSELNYIDTIESYRQAQLTDLVRTADTAVGGGVSYGKRGCVRFQTAIRPSEAEWSEYKSGSRAWEDLSWPQDLYGSTSGARQSWCRIELQLHPVDVDDHSVSAAIPFFGSAAQFYQLER